MTTQKDLPSKLEFLKFIKAPILLASLVWSVATVAFLLAIGALDAARAAKLYDAVFLLGVSCTMVAAGFVAQWYQIRRLHQKFKIVAEILQDLKGLENTDSTK